MRSLVALLLIGCCAGAQAQQPMSPQLSAYLHERIELKEGEVAALARGNAVVKMLPTRLPRDVALFGAAKIPTPRATFVRRLDEPASITSDPSITRFGLLHNPAIMSDVQALSVSAEDIADLKNCRTGSCKAKMSAADMKQLAAAISRAADVQAACDEFTRKRMLDLAADYRRRGNVAMLVYDDEGGVRSSDAFSQLLTQSQYVYEDVPSLRRYLENYPQGKPAGASERVFWALTRVSGLRPTLTLNHLIWYSPPELTSTTLVALKQIYANHYFEAAFTLSAVVDHGPDSYLIVLQRVRFDKLPSGPMRERIFARLRDAFREQLVHQQRQE